MSITRPNTERIGVEILVYIREYIKKKDYTQTKNSHIINYIKCFKFGTLIWNNIKLVLRDIIRKHLNFHIFLVCENY